MTTFERIGKAAATRDNEVLGLTEMVYRAAEGEEVEQLAIAVEKQTSSWWRKWLILVPLFLTLATVVYRLDTADIGPEVYVDVVEDWPKQFRFLAKKIDLKEVDLNLSEEALSYAGKTIKLEPVEGETRKQRIERFGLEFCKLHSNELGAYMIYFATKEIITLEDVEAAEKHDSENDFYRMYWLQTRLWKKLEDDVWGDLDSKEVDSIFSEWNVLLDRSNPIVQKTHLDIFWMDGYRSSFDSKSLVSARASLKQVPGFQRIPLRVFVISVLSELGYLLKDENLSNDHAKEGSELALRLFKEGWGFRNDFRLGRDPLYNFEVYCAYFEELAEKKGLTANAGEFSKLKQECAERKSRLLIVANEGVLGSYAEFEKACPSFLKERNLNYLYEIHIDSLLGDYTEEEVEKDIQPLRHAELTQEVKRGLPFLAVVSLLIVLCLWGWRTIYKVSLRTLSESLLKLLGFRDVLWIALFAFVVPIVTYFIVLSFTPLGGMQFSLGWAYESRWIQLLAVIVFALTGCVCSLRWRLSVAASSIKFIRMRPWEWIFYVVACLGVPVIGVAYSLDDVTKEILLLLSAPSLLALFWVCWPTSHKNPDSRALYSLAMRKGVMMFFVCSAFLMAGPLWTYASLREAYWVKKDQYLKPHQNPFGVNKLEHKVREQLAKQLF